MKGMDGNKVRRPRTFIIGVGGGTSSGKTSVCQRIIELLGENSTANGSRKVAIICQDNFYKELSSEEICLANKSQYNFDHPDAFDTKLMKSTILDIADGKSVKIPEYDFKTHTRRKDVFEELHPCDVVLFEGILAFYHQDVRDLFDMKLFVDTDADTRLSRRVLRDITERARTLESVLQQYTKFVKPAFEEFCLPTKKYADVIIPRGVENTVAIDLIVHHIRDILNGEVLGCRHPRSDDDVSGVNGFHVNGKSDVEEKVVNGTADVNGARKCPSVTEVGTRPH